MGGIKGGDISLGELNKLEEEAKKRLREAGAEGKRHVFISFAHEDERLVEYLRGQAANDKTQLEFADYSIKDPIDSENAPYIKQKIIEQIDKSSVTLVYLSESTANSAWVNWEIQESISRGKGVVGVYQGDSPPTTLPSAINDNNIQTVKWEHKQLIAAIESASTNR